MNADRDRSAGSDDRSGSGHAGGDQFGDDLSGGTVSVLLVDDDETWARTNARLLDRQREAFAVQTATNLAEASDAYEALDPDCVICDYQLERGTGLDLLAAVRERDPDRPFVLVTGEGSEAVASDAIGQRVTDYVRKSAVADRTGLLARQIERAVSAYRTERALERERRSKDAMLDIVTATTSRQGLARDFCRHLVAERDYATAWLGTYSPADGVVPQSVAGEEGYLDVVPPGTSPDAGDEPALVALATGEPCVVSTIDSDGGRDFSSPGEEQAGPDEWPRVASARGFQSAAAVPVEHSGAVVGVLAVYASEENAIDASERDLLTDYGTTIGFALQTAEWKQSLLSSNPVTADVVVRDDVPLVALCRALPTGTTITVRTAVLRDEPRLLYVVDVEGASMEAVQSVAESVDSVESVTVAGESVGRRSDARRFELVSSTPTPESLLVDAGGRFVETVVEGGQATVSVASSSHEGVSKLEAVLEDRYDDISVVSLRSSAEALDGTPLDALTEKQRQALELAFYDGYFERPRLNNATKIAAKLDVSRATFTQHVRSAERKILDRLLDPD